MAFFNVFQKLDACIFRLSNRLMADKLMTLKKQQYLEGIQAHYNSLYDSKATLQKLRNQRLQALLRYVSLYSPWYRKQLTHINIAKFTEERLSELPTMNKDILMQNWDEIVTDRNLTLDLVKDHIEKKNDDISTLFLFDRYHALTTGGSSGKPGVFIFNGDEWNIFYSCFTRYALYNHERTQQLINPTRKVTIAYVATLNTSFALYSFAKIFKSDITNPVYIPRTLPLHQIISRLNQAQPHILSSFPSAIYQLCQEARDGRLKIKPGIIFVASEPLYRSVHLFIRETWPDVNVFNVYGSTEGVTAFSCRSNHDELHLNDDFCIVEPIDEFNKPVPKDVLSKRQYITNLYNYTLPVIRYECSDHLIFLNKKCDCGIQHQLIVAPEGRSEFDFIYAGNLIIDHSLFLEALLAEENIREYQVIQTIEGANIKILTKGPVNTIQLKNVISTCLDNAGLRQPKINITEVGQFEYPLSSKLRRFLKITPL